MRKEITLFDRIILKKNEAIGRLGKKGVHNLKDRFLYFFLMTFLGSVAKIINRRIGNLLIIRKRYVYIALPKVACTSLKKAFRRCGAESISKAKEKIILKDNKYFKFSFVRNPYDRIVSCWKNKVQNPQVRETVGNNMYMGFYKYDNIVGGMTFKEFVKSISELPDEESNSHFKSQYTFLTDKNGKLFVDFIGKFENLEKDYKKMCKRIGVKKIPKLEHKRRSKRKHYREYYDEKTKKLITERYKKDLELFGYKF